MELIKTRDKALLCDHSEQRHTSASTFYSMTNPKSWSASSLTMCSSCILVHPAIIIPLWGSVTTVLTVQQSDSVCVCVSCNWCASNVCVCACLVKHLVLPMPYSLASLTELGLAPMGIPCLCSASIRTSRMSLLYESKSKTFLTTLARPSSGNF